MADQASWADGIVTISSAYGTGGRAIASAVADRLRLPLVDRAIPAGVAQSLAIPVEAAIARDERRPSRVERMIMAMAAGGSGFGVSPLPPSEGLAFEEDSFQAQTERVILDQADSGQGGVVLGRAGAIVLAHHPRTILRARLTGPPDARVAALVSRGGLDISSAMKLVEDHDGAIRDYVRHAYKADIADPALYHLVIDATALPFETIVDLIVTAAQARSQTPPE